MSVKIDKIIRDVLLEQQKTPKVTADKVEHLGVVKDYYAPNGQPVDLYSDGINATSITFYPQSKDGVDKITFPFIEDDCKYWIEHKIWDSDLETCKSYHNETIHDSIRTGSVLSFVHGVNTWIGCFKRKNDQARRVFSGYFGTVQNKHCYAPLWGYEPDQKTTVKKGEGTGLDSNDSIKVPFPDM